MRGDRELARLLARLDSFPYAFPSLRRLGEMLDPDKPLGPDQMRRRLRRIEAAGLLAREARFTDREHGGDGRQVSNDYWAVLPKPTHARGPLALRRGPSLETRDRSLAAEQKPLPECRAAAIRPEPGLEAALRRKYQDRYASIEAVLRSPEALSAPEAALRALSALRVRSARDPGALLTFLLKQATVDPESVSLPLDDPRGAPLMAKLETLRDERAQLGDAEGAAQVLEIKHQVGRRLTEQVEALEQLVPAALPVDMPLALPARRALPAPGEVCPLPASEYLAIHRPRSMALPAPAPTLSEQLAGIERELGRPHLAAGKRLQLEHAASMLRAQLTPKLPELS